MTGNNLRYQIFVKDRGSTTWSNGDIPARLDEMVMGPQALTYGRPPGQLSWRAGKPDGRTAGKGVGKDIEEV